MHAKITQVKSSKAEFLKVLRHRFGVVTKEQDLFRNRFYPEASAETQISVLKPLVEALDIELAALRTVIRVIVGDVEREVLRVELTRHRGGAYGRAVDRCVARLLQEIEATAAPLERTPPKRRSPRPPRSAPTETHWRA
jgi:hypothetical protein